MCATELVLVQVVFGTQRIGENISMFRRTVFVSDACRFHSGEYNE